MKQLKDCKQTLESAEYGLEIVFNINGRTKKDQGWLLLREIVKDKQSCDEIKAN